MRSDNRAAEERMLSQGAARARGQRARAVSAGELLRLSEVRGLAYDALPKVAKAVEKWIAGPEHVYPCHRKRWAHTEHPAWPVLHVLGAELSAGLAIRTMFHGLLHGGRKTRVANAVGGACDEELRILAVKRNTFAAFARLTRATRRCTSADRKALLRASFKAHGLAHPLLSSTTRLHVGIVLVEIVLRETGLFQIELVSVQGGPKERRAVLRAHPEAVAWFERSSAAAELRAPLYAPLPEAPGPWDDNLRGGGYGHEALRRPLVSEAHGVEYVERSCPPAAAAVNLLQGTRWRVNRRVLAVVLEGWERGLECSALPRPEPLAPLGPVPEDAPDDEKRSLRADIARMLANDRSRSGRRIGAALRLEALRNCAESSGFHHAYILDFRGRANALGGYTSWQSSDLSRGCIEFAGGEHLRWTKADALPRAWLARRIAGLWGDVSLLTYEERALWAVENSDFLCSVAADPIETWKSWQEAKEPWQFLAACFAWSDMLSGDGESHWRIPISVDASNNAMQIYSLLAGDDVLARATSVLPAERPSDSYTLVGALAWQRLLREESTHAQDWVRYFREKHGSTVPRSAIKTVNLAFAFGAGAPTTTNRVLDWYNALPSLPFGSVSWKHCQVLSSIVRETIRNFAEPALRVQLWTAQVGAAVAKTGRALCWTSPSGFRVVSLHRVSATKVVRMSLGWGLSKLVHESLPTKQPDVRGAGRALAPNFVQSCDAAVLHLALERLGREGLRDIGTAHDAFAVPPVAVETTHRVLRETYAEVFAPNLLEILHRALEESSEIALPRPPERGELDVSQLRDAMYLFR